MSASNQLAAFNYAVQPLGNLQIKNITAAYTVSPSDSNFILNCTANAFTIAIPPASSFPIGFNFIVWNTTVASVITIDPNGTETIDSVTTYILRSSEGTQVISDGSNWQVGNKKTMFGYAEHKGSLTTRPVASGYGSFAINGQYQGNATASSSFAISGNATSSGAMALNGIAGASNSAAIGQNSGGSVATTATGSGAMALGGSYASGTDSFAAAIANNTSSYGATGANSIALSDRAKASAGQSVCIGQLSQATGVSSLCLSGYGATASGTSSVAIGTNSDFGTPTASGTGAIVIGDGVVASQRYSVALGYGASSAVSGKFASSSGRFVTSGDGQQASLVLRAATTDATATVLLSYSTPASATNQVILPNNSAYAFTGTVVARRQAAGGTESAAWKVEGLIRREANAGTTTLVASTVTAISNVPAWTLALSADTTNGGLAVTATGAASTNIRWVATIQTSEVTYA